MAECRSVAGLSTELGWGIAMTKRRKLLGIGVVLVALLVVWLLFTDSGRQAQFLTGGALVNLGYRMQDRLETYDFEHEHDITPDHVWKEIQKQNA